MMKECVKVDEASNKVTVDVECHGVRVALVVWGGALRLAVNYGQALDGGPTEHVAFDMRLDGGNNG